MSSIIIGLTGGIGSGKTTVTNMFSNLGIDIIDADIIARTVVQPKSRALMAIQTHFGKDYILKNGQLNRSLLRKKIFSDEADKQWLNALLHPLIRDEIIKQTSSAQSPYCILVAPLLIENELLHLVDKVLVVDVDESTQIKRTLKRDTKSTEQEIKAIMASQVTRNVRAKAADDVINNSHDDLSAVTQQINTLHQQYLLFCQNKRN